MTDNELKDEQARKALGKILEGISEDLIERISEKLVEKYTEKFTEKFCEKIEEVIGEERKTHREEIKQFNEKIGYLTEELFRIEKEFKTHQKEIRYLREEMFRKEIKIREETESRTNRGYFKITLYALLFVTFLSVTSSTILSIVTIYNRPKQIENVNTFKQLDDDIRDEFSIIKEIANKVDTATIIK